MMGTVAFGIRLYFRNFGLLALVGLPICIPANLLLTYLTYGVEDPFSQLRIGSIHQAIVGSLYSGIVIATLNQSANGKRVRFSEIIAIGRKCWLPIIFTRFIANFISTFALLAFVIPGILCIVRFAMIDIVVVLEGRNGKDARQRSWELTRECGWTVFFFGTAFYILLILVASISVVVSEYNTLTTEAFFVLEVVNNSLADLMEPLFTAVLLSFYWHATGHDLIAEKSSPINDLNAGTPDGSQDDDNPYRSPQAV